MKILGIDPGTATTGWGTIEQDEVGKLKVKNAGCVLTSSKKIHAERLLEIYEKISAIIKKEKPDVVVVEKLFFTNNPKTAMAVGEARGVCVLAAATAGLEIFEFTPLEVKMALTGYGRADKHQVQKMVQNILKLKDLPKPDDMADALACAICCAHSLKIKKLSK